MQLSAAVINQTYCAKQSHICLAKYIFHEAMLFTILIFTDKIPCQSAFTVKNPSLIILFTFPEYC